MTGIVKVPFLYPFSVKAIHFQACIQGEAVPVNLRNHLISLEHISHNLNAQSTTVFSSFFLSQSSCFPWIVIAWKSRPVFHSVHVPLIAKSKISPVLLKTCFLQYYSIGFTLHISKIKLVSILISFPKDCIISGIPQSNVTLLRIYNTGIIKL